MRAYRRGWREREAAHHVGDEERLARVEGLVLVEVQEEGAVDEVAEKERGGGKKAKGGEGGKVNQHSGDACSL